MKGRPNMKQLLLISLLIALLIPTLAFCEEFDEREMEIEHERDFDNLEHQMHMRRMEMRLQQEQAEMEYQQQMRELELQDRRMDLENAERAAHHKDDMGPLLLICIIVNILTAIWVFQDIRNRGRGSGVWIVIALLTGLLGTLVYAVVRLGEKQT
jgi:hypothetical protein